MPKTASASLRPKTCAMPQSSRMMVTLRASACQRAGSAFWADNGTAETAARAARIGNAFIGKPRSGLVELPACSIVAGQALIGQAGAHHFDRHVPTFENGVVEG